MWVMMMVMMVTALLMLLELMPPMMADDANMLMGLMLRVMLAMVIKMTMAFNGS